MNSNIQDQPRTFKKKNEFIQILAFTATEKHLVHNTQRAKYYGKMFDSIPEAAQHEQMSETIKQVDINFEKKTVVVTQSFSSKGKENFSLKVGLRNYI